MKTKRFFYGALVSMTVIAVTAGVSYAVWTASGSGSAEASATITQSLVVTAVTPTNGSLYPGGPAGPVSLSIQNPNPYAVTVTSLSWGTPYSTSTSACPSSDISVDANAPTTVSISIPASSTATDQVINGVLDLAHAAGNGCQGVNFIVPVTVSGTQQ